MSNEDEKTLPVVSIGLGHLGRDILRAVLAEPGLELVGVVDPRYGGQALRDLIDGAAVPERTVESDLAAALSRARGGVALVATVSRFDEILPTLYAAAEAGVNVVSTCEELSFPYLGHREEADELDATFAAAGVSCLGTGVNPGFVLDRLACVLGSVTREVRRVVGLRVVDVSTRRVALQHKVGAGLSLDEFTAASEAGKIGHVGLPESAALVGVGLGFEIDEVDEEITPLVAEEDFDTGDVVVRTGAVAGVHQVARAFDDGREIVRLELEMYVGAENPHDTLRLDATPPLELVFPSGVPGGAASVAAVVNAARPVVSAQPGLMTVLDLPAGR